MMTRADWEMLATKLRLNDAQYAEKDEAFNSSGTVRYVETNEYGMRLGLAGVVHQDFGQTTHVGNTSEIFEWAVLEHSSQNGNVISFKHNRANGGDVTITMR